MTETLAPGRTAETRVRPEPVVRLTLRRTVGELVLGAVFAVLFSLVLQAAANRIGTDPGTYVPAALVNLGTAVILAVLFALVAFGRTKTWPQWAKLLGAWGVLTAFATIVLAIPLQATRFFLGGSSVDNTFRLQYMERMASSASLADVNYHGLAPYYPGGWFWLGGRFANLLGLEGWAAYKPYSITWAAVAAVVTFVLWSLVLRRRLALLATVATVIAGFVSVGVEEPYAWPTSAWLPPIAVLTWTVLRPRRGWAPDRGLETTQQRAPAWVLILIGVYLGFSAITYTLHVAFGVVLVVVLALIAAFLDIRGGEPRWPAIRRQLVRLVVIGAVTALLALITWAPFILAGGLGKPNVAAHFLPEISAYFPTPFAQGSVFGVLCLAGLVWLVVRARRDPVAFTLLIVTVLVYAWFAVSTLALVAQTTLLAFRFVVTIDVVLMIAGVFGSVELVRHARRWFPAALTVGLVLAVAGAVTLTQQSGQTALADMINRAESDYYPDGHNAKGEHDPNQDGAWIGELNTAIDQLTGRAPTDNIVLSANDRLLSFRPYWGFQQTTPHYANPLALYTERSAEIRSWAAATSTDDLLTRLADSPHEAANVFVLRKDGARLTFGLASDTFPQASPVHVDEIGFDPKLFDSSRFVQRDVGIYRVIVLR